jgi:predicted lysophospholipase L1 biosynthesis ABC-type transport system permease subunit
MRIRAATDPLRVFRPYSAAMPWARRSTVGIAVLAALHVAATVVLGSEPAFQAWAAIALALTFVPLSSGLSLLVARRAEGAVVGVLLALLSLAVAHVVGAPAGTSGRRRLGRVF